MDRVIPLAIVGSHRFYETLVNFLGLIGYWAAVYIAIILLEHKIFRRSNFSSYDLTQWNDPKRLPWGAAALGASIISIGLIVPSMEQVWFVGPIGKKTGDIGFEMGFALGGLAYIPLRWLEIKLSGRL
jgi:purine-cytosine permease-like protein